MRRFRVLGATALLLVQHVIAQGVFAVHASAQSPTAILDRVRVNAQRPIDFHAIALPETVYVGQQATYQVAVLLSPDARSRLRRNPEFLPPELRGLLAYELGTPIRVAPRSFGTATFEAHVFQRALFPVAAGRHTVPAPQLTYALPQSASYFSREEQFMVRAESAAFIARPLPLEGRPEDFSGAVGVFKAAVRMDTVAARVGDPLVLTLRVQGVGNVKLLPRPSIEIDWASAVPGSERVAVDSSGPLVRGTKEFDWILTPARDGRVTVPVLRYTYFDPYTARYAAAESEPVAVDVRPGTLATVDEREPGALLSLRPLDGAVASPVRWTGHGLPPSAWWWWIVVALLAPIPALWWSRPRRASAGGRAVPPRALPEPTGDTSGAPHSATAYGADGLRHAADERVREAVRAVRRTFLETLASRFAQSPQSLVSRRYVARLLRRSGVTRATTRDALALLEQLDERGFAPAASGHESSASAAEGLARDLLRRIDDEAVPRGARLDRSAMILLVVTLGGAHLFAAASTGHAQGRSSAVSEAGSASAESDQAESDPSAAASEAYARRSYAEAAQRFAALAEVSPNAPDILANWGTAAWAAGDTVSAVIAWQRAARIEPLAVDLQERIGLLPAGARGGIADVPMIPVPLLLRLAVGGWLLGWMIFGGIAYRTRAASGAAAELAFDATRTGRWMRSSAQLLLLLGVAAGGAAWWGMRVMDASALAVVTRPETMRIAPGMEADAMGGVTTGDVVRIEDSRDVWQRVVHADGRRGWLPAYRLTMLRPPAARAVMRDGSVPDSAAAR